MNFGMFTDFHVRRGASQAEAFDESFAQVTEAEQMGFDTVWLAEHHFSPERAVLASPMVIASAIAARTERIRTGLAVQVLPLTNPLRVAEEAATVDHISKGRFDFGIGRSGLTKYYQGYNVPYSESRSRFLEALDIIMKAWREDSFSHEGEYHSFHGVTVTPKPFQQPHPPVRVAVAGEDTFPLVGEMGHPIFISANTPRDALKERLAAYRKKLSGSRAAGVPDIAIRVPVYCAETTEQAQEEPRSSALSAIQYAASELIQTAANPEIAERMKRIAAAPYEQVLQERVVFGTPAEIVDTFKGYQEDLGVTGVVLEVNYGGQIPADQVVKSLRLISNEVMPRFK